MVDVVVDVEVVVEVVVEVDVVVLVLVVVDVVVEVCQSWLRWKAPWKSTVTVCRPSIGAAGCIPVTIAMPLQYVPESTYK